MDFCGYSPNLKKCHWSTTIFKMKFKPLACFSELVTTMFQYTVTPTFSFPYYLSTNSSPNILSVSFDSLTLLGPVIWVQLKPPWSDHSALPHLRQIRYSVLSFHSNLCIQLALHGNQYFLFSLSLILSMLWRIQISW